MGFKYNFCCFFLLVYLTNLSSSQKKYDAINRCHFVILDALIMKYAKFRCICGSIDREHEIFGNPNQIKAFTFASIFDIKEDEYDRGIVDEIHFDYCHFTTLKRNIFETFYSVQTFSIPNVDLETLDVNMFRKARNLTILDISGNRLKEIPSHLFVEAVKLKELDFSANFITKVHPLAFEGATELQKLNLSLNQLSDLDAHTFTLPKLLVLDLSNNNITALNENVFDKLESLKILILSFNALEHLPTATFAKLFDLEELSLRHANLSNILPGTFSHQSKLISLDLSENNLKKFDYTLLHSVLLNLKSLRLGKNQLSDLNGLQSTSFPQMTLFDIQGNLFNCSYLQHTMESLSMQWEKIRFHNETVLIDVHKSYIRGINCSLAPAAKVTTTCSEGP